MLELVRVNVFRSAALVIEAFVALSRLRPHQLPILLRVMLNMTVVVFQYEPFEGVLAVWVSEQLVWYTGSGSNVAPAKLLAQSV